MLVSWLSKDYLPGPKEQSFPSQSCVQWQYPVTKLHTPWLLHEASFEQLKGWQMFVVGQFPVKSGPPGQKLHIVGSASQSYKKWKIFFRVVLNFKHWKFVWNLLIYHTLSQKQHIEAKILKIEQHLGMALCDQNFTVYCINVLSIKIDQKDIIQIFSNFLLETFLFITRS